MTRRLPLAGEGGRAGVEAAAPSVELPPWRGPVLVLAHARGDAAMEPALEALRSACVRRGIPTVPWWVNHGTAPAEGPAPSVLLAAGAGAWSAVGPVARVLLTGGLPEGAWPRALRGAAAEATLVADDLGPYMVAALADALRCRIA